MNTVLLFRKNKQTMTTQNQITNFTLNCFRIAVFPFRNLVFSTDSLSSDSVSYPHRCSSNNLEISINSLKNIHFRDAFVADKENIN